MSLSPGTFVVGIFAVLFGLAGAYAVKEYMKPGEVAEAPPEIKTYVVPLAGDDLAPGRPLTINDIMLVSGTKEEIAKYNLPAMYMANAKQIAGRILRKPVAKGEAFVTTAFYPDGTGPSVADRLQPGFRAVTIALNGGAVNGFASPGTFVDVLFRANPEEEEGRPETTVTLIEAVEVLAIDGNSVPGSRVPETPRRVTLAVAAGQANALKIAEGNGLFSLSLRSLEDDQVAANQNASTLRELLNLPPQEAPFASEIYRRGRRQAVSFEGGQVTMDTGVPVVQTSTPAAEPASQQPAN